MKEIIITASGEKVPPRPIEDAIKRELPVVSNALVIGEQQRFLCCLLTLKVKEDTIPSAFVFNSFSSRLGRMRPQACPPIAYLMWLCRVARQQEAPPSQ